ncbi:type IV pilin-related protein [Thermotoga sp. Mc24]|uniref:type II secretion system protein n=1 Tax=Thermotoga sp. Mc24 TaxID=1231241 RepID=UPI0005441B13|nr:type II secretion system protein [Thermotoga sp. Mc24]KHC91446.1 type IV pilin-related protein [Thermotoga sp. Mc24]
MKRRAGFTLIELLIVMAIIAALMAVLIPTATGAMRKARATRIAVQLRNLEQGAEQWLMATLPDEDSFNNNELDLENAADITSYVDSEFLDDDNLTTFKAIANTTENEITIVIEYDTNIAKLVYDALKDTYGSGGTYTRGQASNLEDGVYYDETNGSVAIVKTIQAFWW